MIRFLKGKGESKPEYIIAILLKQEEGVGFVLEVQQESQSIALLDQRSFRYSNSWESLIYDIDELLFRFETDHKIQLKKTIFFVYSHLVDYETGELKQTYLETLQKAIEENDLESLGYFELDELLARSYAQREGEGLRAVFVEIDVPAVSACVYQGGKRIFAETVAKTQDLVADLEEIYSHLESGKKLPPRIIMYDSSSLESESHHILTHKWNDDLFQHAPKVEVMKEAEMRHAFEEGIHQHIFPGSTTVVSTASESIAEQAQDSLDHASHSQDMNEDDHKGHQSVMGFMIGGEVGDRGIDGWRDRNVEGRKDGNVEVWKGGEGVGVEVGETEYKDQSTKAVKEETHQFGTTIPPSYAQPDAVTASHVSPIAVGRSIVQKITNTVSSLRMIMYGKGKIIILGIGLIAFAIVGTLLLLYFNHSAVLTIMYKREPIEKDITLSNMDSIQEVKKTFTAGASSATTGQKDIGEKAKGEVTVYSADDKERTIKKSTILTTDDGVEFTLDSDISVKAASKTITDDGDILTSTSKTQATLTAVEIGPKSNIKQDTKLSISDLPSTTYFAKVSKAFSGGTQKTIQTASKEDLAKLDKDIEKQLKKKTAESLATMSSQKKVIEALTNIDITKRSYSKEPAEEASNVQETVTADVAFYAYNEGDLREQILSQIQDDISEGYTLGTQDLAISDIAAKKDEKTNKISLKVKVKGEPVMQLDTAKLAKDVQGLPLDALKRVIQDVYNADGFDAEISTALPFLKSRLPYFSKHIAIRLEPISD